MNANESGKKIQRIEIEGVTSIRDEVNRVGQATATIRVQMINLVENRGITIYGATARTIETVGTPEIRTRATLTITRTETQVANER